LIALGPVYRSLHTDNELFYECGYLANFDAIAMGCLVAMLMSRFELVGARARALRILAGAGLVVFYLRGIEHHEIWGFSLVALCTALYLIASVRDPAASLAGSRAMAWVRWFGRHSYELYLFHIIVLALARNVWDRKTLPEMAWAPWLGLYVAVSALVAMGVARYFSEPANQAIRSRFTSAPRPPRLSGDHVASALPGAPRD
jgi:peptidoglycan/LPS O-acetylase OafA/YrhL